VIPAVGFGRRPLQRATLSNGLFPAFGSWTFTFERTAHTLLQGRHDAHGLLMFLEQVSERFVGQLLKALALLAHDGLDGLPSLVIELNALAGHRSH
jgi:hypothetical protein